MNAQKKRATGSYKTYTKGVFHLSKLMDVISIDDLTKKELKDIELAFFEASKGMNKVHDIFISVLNRCEEEGHDLLERKERKQIKKRILKK